MVIILMIDKLINIATISMLAGVMCVLVWAYFKEAILAMLDEFLFSTSE